MKSRKVFLIQLVLIFAITLMSFSSQAKSYTYIDGNNNDYEITGDSVFYSPITSAESSSGEYSGGNPKRVKISSEQFVSIESVIKSILKDKSNHIKTRLMGCGTLIIGKKTTYVNANSKLKAELEQKLKSFLNQN